ncbi:class I SAM-dependent methyltransferase [Spirosoma fluviale]|uniref:Methyltransferase domain-containing protein n=1 Tax=Spirosoma fluviale TaxID=1597977 RepID=A0A286G5J4_9BACT|nr:methyltransferase domain-containing protein [Spirosoma fluviale]SOD90773.1 Methyltransferase domain-containing protein [Spirosoma fluviale]
MASTWLDFWQRENEFDESMSTNFNYFLERVETHIPLAKTNRVLDIGSGPGNLEDAWHDRVAEIHGLDISKRYNELARTRHVDSPNVFFHDLDPNDYLNFSPVANRQFDVIIVMSVVQYYRSIGEVEQLLQLIKRVAAPGARALVCDLMVGESFLSDVLGILKRSLLQGKLIATLKLLVRLRFSHYHTVRKENGFLVIPETEWLAMCERVGLKAQFINEPITLQQERRNLLITF